VAAPVRHDRDLGVGHLSRPGLTAGLEASFVKHPIPVHAFRRQLRAARC